MGDAPAPSAPRVLETGGVLLVRLDNAPPSGRLRFLLFDRSDAFGKFREELRVVEFEADGRAVYRIEGVPPGTYALVVHLDENRNGFIDRNFIGIPREPVAISNRYEPKGPPSFARARFDFGADEVRELDTALFSVLGDFGRLGVGVGVIARSSPYLGAGGGVFQPIPAISFNAGPIQLLGPNLRAGLVGDDRLRLAATASYRIGFYDEDDSPALVGLGDRKDTLMAGLAVVAEPPGLVDLELGYEHDVLDQIGGGAARFGVSRSFSWGLTRLTPKLGFNWTSAELSNHDWGVPPNAATAERPAYDVGDTLNVEAGVSSFLELSDDWRVILDLSVEGLDKAIRRSPIVDADYVVKGFVAVTFVF